MEETPVTNSMDEVRVVQNLQNAFGLITTLQMTGYLWPLNANVRNGSSYDYIVVGAGSGGCVVANRLTEDKNTSVLLIEAGGDPPIESVYSSVLLYLQRSRLDWNFTGEYYDKCSSKCHRDPYTRISQGKVLGGTSCLNFMTYIRGHADTYDNWAAITNDTSWKYDNVLPYFKKSENLMDNDIKTSPDRNYHGYDGYLGVSKDPRDISDYLGAYKEMGNKIVNDLNGNETLGYAPMLLTVANENRQSAAYSFLRTAKDRPNLDVVKNTMVTKILFDKQKKANGVTAVTYKGKIMTFKATKEVIVCAGAISTPKLLMLSGIGPKNHLTSKGIKVISNLPVGQNLQDHFAASLAINLDKAPNPPPPIDPRALPSLATIGHATLSDSKGYPDYQTRNYAADDRRLVLRFCIFAFGFSNEICDYIFNDCKDKKVLYVLLSNLRPNARGNVTLLSANPLDYPVIHNGYYDDHNDIHNLALYLEDYAKLVDTKFFKSFKAKIINPLASRCGEIRDNCEFWRCYARCMSSGMGHFTSTCAMGSVVDTQLFVKGVKSLRVVDASVMPIIPDGDPNAATIMIAEKASDMIKRDQDGDAK